jgi:hypothetical protein
MTGNLQLTQVDNVEVFIAQHRECAGLYCLEQQVTCPWLADEVEVAVIAVAEITAARVNLAVTLKPDGFIGAAADGFADLVAELGATRIDLTAPLALAPVHIPKPWGQEIWYTGVEQRGVCDFVQADQRVAIPYLLALFPSAFNHRQQLVLLKILDPLAEEVFGDLYFELHTKKQEVYVVTHVDEGSWPSGKGAIRFGFDQDKLDSYASDQAFRAAYSQAVKSYRQVRVEVDCVIDQLRQKAGIALDAPVSAELLKSWMLLLPAELAASEQLKRRQMEAFTQLKPLVVGDVVQVPCYTPHALQHGVRTIEFQTPVYERLIVSFAQKVLTQQHWDSEQAINVMNTDAAEVEIFDQYDFVSGQRGEIIVDYDDFYVVRARLSSGESLRVDNNGGYIIVMSVDHMIAVNGCQVAPEQAVLLPALVDVTQVDAGNNDATMLICFPKYRIE